MVGIFWFFPDFSDLFYVHKVDINFAQKYGDWLISNKGHSDVWDMLEQDGYLKCLAKSHQEEYWKIPRGRVSYNTLDGKHYVYHGNWFLKKYAKIIEKEFSLSINNIIYEKDEHYNLKEYESLKERGMGLDRLI